MLKYNYVDPASCERVKGGASQHPKVFSIGEDELQIKCDSNSEVLLGVSESQIVCPAGYKKIFMSGESAKASSLPFARRYTCIDPDNAMSVAPYSVNGFCCDVKTI